MKNKLLIMIIKNFIDFIKENIEEQQIIPEEKVFFSLSPKFVKFLINFDGYKVADLYKHLPAGVQRKYLVKDPVDYLDIDKDNNVSFLKSRYFSEDNKWESTRRQKMKITKVIKDIYNESYLNINLKQTDIESFSNKLSSFLKPTEILELRGNDVLRAYNYKREIDQMSFGFTCANFGQKEPGGSRYDEPSVNWFDIYTKNPENIGVVIIIDKGKIVGRRNFQQGIQLIDNGIYKKGEFYTVYGNYYGENGVDGKYDIVIVEYLKNKYNAILKATKGGGFKIKLKETRFEQYCPFDSMFVNFKTNELSDIHFTGSSNTYKARCPIELVKQRISEESSKKSEDVMMNVIDTETTPK